MGISYGKGKKGTAGKLHSQVIRSAGTCEHCGGANSLQAAHIMSRRFVATYTSLRNAYCLCAACHRMFTDHPVEFGKFVQRTWAKRYYNELYKASREGVKTTDEFWQGRIDFLKEMLRKIESGELLLIEARALDKLPTKTKSQAK